MIPKLKPATAAALLILVSSVLAADDRKPTQPQRRSASPAPMPLRVASDPRYRAIFCGEDGTETGRGYSQALALDLAHLAASGRATADALAAIEARACDRK